MNADGIDRWMMERRMDEILGDGLWTDGLLLKRLEEKKRREGNWSWGRTARMGLVKVRQGKVRSKW